MMRALAEFIMRGRMQACLIALVGNLLPLISPATVGLVTLRQRFQDGLLVLLWAGMPLMAALFLEWTSALVALSSLVGLISVIIAGEVLKATTSWQLALVAVLATCLVGVQAVAIPLDAETMAISAQVSALIADQQMVTPDSGVSPFIGLMALTAAGLGVENANAVLVLGFLAWLAGIGAIGALLVARWWQSLLYNPGGFQQEFHGMRFDRLIGCGLMAAVIACNVLAPEYMTWASLFGLPLLLAGLGLAHFVVKSKKLGVVWLIVLYVGLVLIGPLSMVLIVVGFLDSFLNLRSRFAGAGENR
jgi:hypothetical protein